MIGNSVVALKKSYFCVQTLKKRKAGAVFIKQHNTMFIIGGFFSVHGGCMFAVNDHGAPSSALMTKAFQLKAQSQAGQTYKTPACPKVRVIYHTFY